MIPLPPTGGPSSVSQGREGPLTVDDLIGMPKEEADKLSTDELPKFKKGDAKRLKESNSEVFEVIQHKLIEKAVNSFGTIKINQKIEKTVDETKLNKTEKDARAQFEKGPVKFLSDHLIPKALQGFRNFALFCNSIYSGLKSCFSPKSSEPKETTKIPSPMTNNSLLSKTSDSETTKSIVADFRLKGTTEGYSELGKDQKLKVLMDLADAFKDVPLSKMNEIDKEDLKIKEMLLDNSDNNPIGHDFQQICENCHIEEGLDFLRDCIKFFKGGSQDPELLNKIKNNTDINIATQQQLPLAKGHLEPAFNHISKILLKELQARNDENKLNLDAKVTTVNTEEFGKEIEDFFDLDSQEIVVSFLKDKNTNSGPSAPKDTSLGSSSLKIEDSKETTVEIPQRGIHEQVKLGGLAKDLITKEEKMEFGPEFHLKVIKEFSEKMVRSLKKEIENLKTGEQGNASQQLIENKEALLAELSNLSHLTDDGFIRTRTSLSARIDDYANKIAYYEKQVN
ncbi:MAG: hypothetical protein H0U49_09590 [Parachlamydiaceae bacterium]|nr:hypothetical protein [Parachlamydiaceae bacterium]